MINGARIPLYAPRTPTQRMSRNTKRFLPRLRRWRQKARCARRKLAGVPRMVQITGVVAILLAVVALTNIVYQVIHKPTELFAFVGHRLDKEPAETWRQYGALFRTYSTGTIPPELLAALAQGERSGNPVAISQPASSAVGLFQMTDGAYAEAARFCIRANAVTDTGCGFGPYIRAIASHAIELASVYLDRNVAAVLARADMTASTQQKQDVAAFIHLCGGGPATAFVRRKFRMLTDERCGDHLVAAYVSRVNAMKRQFVRLAADGRN